MTHSRKDLEEKIKDCNLAKNFLVKNYSQFQKCQVEYYPKTWGFSSKDKTIKCVKFNAMLFKLVNNCEMTTQNIKPDLDEKKELKM